MDNPLTVAEERELLQRLRALQDVDFHGLGPPACEPEHIVDAGRYARAGGGMTPDRSPEAAVRSAPSPRDVTGRGITSAVHMELADLGIMRWDPDRNAIAAMFGDNFSFGWGQEWQSPSVVMYDRHYNVLGIPETGNRIAVAGRRQLWDYPHNNPDYSTILPCDFIRVNGIWYVAAMVTQGLGNEKWTVFWQSRDLVNWQKTSPYLSLAHRDPAGHFIGHPGNTMLTFDQIGDYVYIFGTGGLARDRGIWMWRNPADQFPHGWWEPWGWDGHRWGWGIPNERSPILDGAYGELSFRHVQGHCVLSFFDARHYRQQVRTVKNPEDNWLHGANVVDYAFGWQIPQLYGGYISPLSRLNEPNGMHFMVSQWNTQTNNPYRVMLVQNALTATGPVDRGRAPGGASFRAGPEFDYSTVVPAEPDYSEVITRSVYAEIIAAPPDHGDGREPGAESKVRPRPKPSTTGRRSKTTASTARRGS
ncbi:DUF4185 domain-containing protein [Mycolicibacterium litorale]|uniref:DUF4185 domain-containing protein n=1 Tax=Mycolicibacterium litorale TaxID=758802 RepID=UPI003CEE6E14